MLSLRKRTVEKRNSRGAVVRKEEVVTLTRKLHGSTKAKGEKLHGSTKAKGEKLYGSTKAKGEKLQRPPSKNHLQAIKLPLPPPPTTPIFRENMYHPVMKGISFREKMSNPKGNRGELFQKQGYGKFSGQTNQGYGMFSGQTNNQDFVQFESSKRQEERALLSTSMANAKANVTKYSDAEGSDAEGSDAKESEADNIISSEESEAESEAEDTNSEEFEAEDMSSEESEAESEVESEAESEAENTNSEESDEAEDSDDEPPRSQVDIHRAMRTLSMQRQERRNYAYW